MRAAIHVIMKNEMKSTMIETITCHVGMPKGMRAIITMGEVKGIMEHQKTRPELGSFIMFIITIMAKMTGIIMMLLN